MRKIYLFLLALCVSGVSSIATAQKFELGNDLSASDVYNPGDNGKGRYLTGLTLQPQKSNVTFGAKQTVVVNEDISSSNYTTYTVYNDLTSTTDESKKFHVKAGQSVKPGFVTTIAGWMHAYVFVDANQDNVLTISSPDELLSKTQQRDSNDDANWWPALPEFRVPTTDGSYAMRYKNDWLDGNPTASDELVRDGGSITDILMVVEYARVAFTYDNTKGTVTGITEGLVCGEDYTFTVTPNEGLSAMVSATCGTQTVAVTDNGNGTYTVAADKFQNDMSINVVFVEPSTISVEGALAGRCYFRLKNVNHGTYLKSGVSSATATANETDGIEYVTEGNVYAYAWNPNDDTEATKQASYIWKITPGTSKMLTSQGYQMVDLKRANNGGTDWNDVSVKLSMYSMDEVSYIEKTDGSGNPCYAFTTCPAYDDAPRYIHCTTLGRRQGTDKYPTNVEGNNTCGYLAMSGTNMINASFWYVEPITEFNTTIGTGGWSSINYAFPVSLPAASVTAYTVASEGNGFVELAEIPATDGEILLPSNTPAFIEGTEGETVTVTILLEEPEANIAKAEGFKGTTLTETKELTSTEAVYGIATVDNVTALYKMRSGTTIPCNKAYYETTASGVAKFELNFGETTGIDTLAPAMLNDNTLYDLNGRRVLYPIRGIYVTASGRKIYVK